MVNSESGLIKTGKDAKHDFVSYIEELKSRLDIVQVAELHGISINKNGQAECFNGHDEKTQSLKFYEDTQSYHCFGCGAHGDVISLLQHIDGCSFSEAVSAIARETGLSPFQSNNGFNPERYAMVSDCLNTAANIYHSWLTPDDSYLEQRGISYETATKFNVGRTRDKEDLRIALKDRGVGADTILYSGLVKADGTDFFQNHIVVPIYHAGRVVDFYGRSQNGHPQRHWRLPNDRFVLGNGLFNWNPSAKEIILVEGIFDALALIQEGFPHAVTTLGTQGLNGSLPAIRKGHIKKAFVCYDGDLAGNGAAVRSA
jgi:DNA primase